MGELLIVLGQLAAIVIPLTAATKRVLNLRGRTVIAVSVVFGLVVGLLFGRDDAQRLASWLPPLLGSALLGLVGGFWSSGGFKSVTDALGSVGAQRKPESEQPTEALPSLPTDAPLQDSLPLLDIKFKVNPRRTLRTKP